jgi:hypothetical protein
MKDEDLAPFAIVTMYGRILACMSRWALRGICHPEQN